MRIKKLKGLFEQYNRHSQEEQNKVIDKVLDAGGTIVRPKPGELQLDIDSREVFDKLFYQIAKFEKESPYEIEVVSDFPSHSGYPHRHVTLLVLEGGVPVDFEVSTKVALQMYFGSDIYRELHNLLRVENGASDPCLFFEGVKWSEVA